MVCEGNSVKQWRPRFSVRTLFIVVALVCTYLGCWEATKRRGCSQLPQSWSPAPLLICSDGYRSSKANMGIVSANVLYPCRNYDLWLFGPKMRIWRTDRAEVEQRLEIELTP
jgi:hypothetical protein